MEKNEEDRGAKLLRYALMVLLGGGVALGTCLLFLLVASFCISHGWLGEEIMYQLAVVGCVLGGFVGGAVAIRQCRTRSLIVGLLVGCVLFLLLMTVGMLWFDAAAPDAGGIGLICGGLCGGAAAGILGGAPKKKRRK